MGTTVSTCGRHSRLTEILLPPLGVSDGLVGEVGDVAIDGLGVDKAHGFLVAGLAEEALAGPEHDREDLQPQLVDEVVLHERAHELVAGGDDYFPLNLMLEPPRFLHHVALQYHRVVPGRTLAGRPHHGLRMAVPTVRQLPRP